MFIRSSVCLAFFSILINACVLIGYDALVDGSETDSSVGRADGSTHNPNDASSQDAASERDAFIPPMTDGAVDSGAEAATADGAMDSSQQDASDSGPDSTLDDAPTNECESGEIWCEGDKLFVCSSSGDAELSQDCATLGNRCERGVCNASEGKCEKQPASADTRWCDGDISMSCDGLGAVVTAADCSMTSTVCSTGVCDSNTGQCELKPITEDKFWCEGNALYTCDSDGSPALSQNCSDLDDPCNSGVCDTTNNICIKQPVALNSPCFGYGQCDESGSCICPESGVWCYEDQLLSCDESGLVVSREDCSTLSNACNVGVCDPDGPTCTREPITENSSCGFDGSCDAQGRCVFGHDSCSMGVGGRCSISCDPDISPCLLDCSDTMICEATCQAEAICDIECSSDSSCSATCEAGSVCNLSCTNTAVSCIFDCREAESCYNVSCPGPVGCVLACDPAFSKCSFDSCSNEIDCGNGIYACNAACPPTP